MSTAGQIFFYDVLFYLPELILVKVLEDITEQVHLESGYERPVL